jgi:hypothetical protein
MIIKISINGYFFSHLAFYGTYLQVSSINGSTVKKVKEKKKTMTLEKKLNSYLSYDVLITELKKIVILDILDIEKEYQENYIRDVLQHGCQSGIVGGLIYHRDTEKFALKHFNEIIDLYQCYAEDFGKDGIINPMLENNPLNWLAWFGYEETMREIANELDIE